MSSILGGSKLPDEVSFGEIVYPPGGTLGPRLQHSIQIALVTRGSMSIEVDGHRLEVPAHNACLLLPGHREFFAFAKATETHHSWVHLTSREQVCPKLLERLRSLRPVIPLSYSLASRMRMLLDSPASRLPTAVELQVLLAHVVLFQFIGEAVSSSDASAELPVALEWSLQFIDEHLDEHLDTGAIASAGAVSRSHLMRLFHRHLDTTPGRYVWRRRVERSLWLLQDTGLPLGEIARRCGFKNSHHFSRKVLELTGSTPTQHRRRAWEPDGPAEA